MHSVRFENVSFGYEENKNIISNLSFEIKKGDKVAIVGANGQGKTTLVKLLMGIYTPTDGNIYVNDVNIKSIKKNDYQKSIAALFQENPIFAFSLLENIACEADDNADYDKINNIIDLIKMREAIDNLPDGIRSKYSNYFSKDGVFLSGGQMQKIYMARMFYKGGDLFILDEPTASLDPKAEREVYDLYNELLSDKITVFISHRLGTTRFCNRIIYLEGNNSNMGTFNDLYRDNDGFRKMYDEQKKYYEEAM